MSEDWLDRWDRGRTGWHEADGNAGLKAHWTRSAGRVLVPLCGKSPDLVWLAARGHQVTGVELAEKAIVEFFDEQGLDYARTADGAMMRYDARDTAISLFCGDYFSMTAEPFDALYDRGALVAIEPSMRERYIQHTNTLLRADAARLVVTLEYDQSITPGPPFAVHGPELLGYWPDLERVAEFDDIDSCPPKFIAAGVTEIAEVIWRSG